METTNEFIRLSNNEPLTLVCSALANFLWEDFVRDTRPNVRYLSDRYNIRQLSRFGKEVFDRLYSGDNVEWLISLDDYEEYFRQVCDKGAAPMPQGYKPENGFWWGLMGDLTEAAAWPELLARCVGEQFNAGNNAVNILNRLSEVIEEAIEQQKVNVDVLVNSGQKLEELRDKFKKANEAGDKSEADKARAEGKKLVQDINKQLEDIRNKVQPYVSDIIDRTIKDNDKLDESISNLWGSKEGQGSKIGNLAEKKALAKRLKSNKELQKIAAKLGALKRVWFERKRAKKLKENYASIVGAQFSNNVTKAFATELALAGSPQGQALFAMKYAHRTILTKDYEAHNKQIGKGPIVLYVDVSGSMRGNQEDWSKAIAFVIAEEAMKDNRKVQINLFDTRIMDSIELDKDRKNNQELLDFVGLWTLGGGTSFNAVLIHAANNKLLEDRADVLLITDGNSEVTDPTVKKLEKLKAETGTQWSTICLNTVVPPVCHRFSDDVYSVDLSKDAETIDVIQKCLR